MQQRCSKILNLDLLFGIPQHYALKVLASRPKSEEAVVVPAPLGSAHTLALCHQSMYPSGSPVQSPEFKNDSCSALALQACPAGWS